MKREGKHKDFVLHIALTSMEASNIHPPEGGNNMPGIQALSHLRRPAEYYGGHQQQTDDLMSQYLQDGKQSYESVKDHKKEV